MDHRTHKPHDQPSRLSAVNLPGSLDSLIDVRKDLFGFFQEMTARSGQTDASL
jgi:hypothetical protein